MLLRHHLALLLGLALLGLGPGQAHAEDLSLKVENYIFAASEALDDGDPALALSLLRRAASEAPGSCIIEEYLCRCYVALGNVEMARGAYGRFAACMEVTDEGVLAELDRLIVEAEQAPATEPDPVPPPALAGTDSPPPTFPEPVPTPADPTARGGTLGWVLLGSGAVVGVAGGVGSWLSWSRGQQYIEDRDRDSYVALAPLNHAAVIGGAVGGAVAVTGLAVGIAGRSRSVQAAPWLAPSSGLGLTASVEF